jgi:hypothetical protein
MAKQRLPGQLVYIYRPFPVEQSQYCHPDFLVGVTNGNFPRGFLTKIL